MTINLENTLEILCPTYNRAPFLKNTLEQLFAPNSPVKNCHMTFLDNASTDDTPRLLAQYAAQHPIYALSATTAISVGTPTLPALLKK